MPDPVAGCPVCDFDVNAVATDISGSSAGTPTTFSAYGSLESVSVSLVWTINTADGSWAGDLLMAGDCLSPRTCEEAVLEGLKAGVTV